MGLLQGYGLVTWMLCTCRRLCRPRSSLSDTPTTGIYTLSLHDALPISPPLNDAAQPGHRRFHAVGVHVASDAPRLVDGGHRSEEHTSELQSHVNLVCRLLLEKKKTYSASYFVVSGTSMKCAHIYHRM